MKNIFKKNHIIITALAIMIVIAGYLSFVNRDDVPEKDLTTVENPDSDDLKELAELEGLELVTDTTTDDTATDDTTNDTAADDTTNDTTLDDNDETTPVKTQDATDELGESDISDDDMLADAKDVTDSGELDLEDGTPGEAVLVNATQDAGYFLDAKIKREQTRAKNKATYMDIMKSADITEEQKQSAINAALELTTIADQESAAEILLGARGFEDVVVFIVDGSADVVVNASTLSNQQLAIIEDVVKDKTGITVDNIHITPVVVQD